LQAEAEQARLEAAGAQDKVLAAEAAAAAAVQELKVGGMDTTVPTRCLPRALQICVLTQGVCAVHCMLLCSCVYSA